MTGRSALPSEPSAPGQGAGGTPDALVLAVDAGAVANAAVPPRRRLLKGAVATTVVAAVGAAAWRGWRSMPTGAAPGAGLWQQTFPTPEGGVLALADLQGKPLVLNFWATWCPPCIAELPLLDTFFRENAANGWQMVGIAVDQPAAVRDFLGRVPVNFPVALALQGGMALSRSLGNLAGGLPFTVVLGADGQVRHRKIGQVTPPVLKEWVALHEVFAPR